MLWLGEARGSQSRGCPGLTLIYMSKHRLKIRKKKYYGPLHLKEAFLKTVVLVVVFI